MFAMGCFLLIFFDFQNGGKKFSSPFSGAVSVVERKQFLQVDGTLMTSGYTKDVIHILQKGP